MKPNIKKLLILNAPYLLFVWLFMKAGEAFRLSPGADLSGKLLHIMEGVTAAFESISGKASITTTKGIMTIKTIPCSTSRTAKPPLHSFQARAAHTRRTKP